MIKSGRVPRVASIQFVLIGLVLILAFAPELECRGGGRGGGGGGRGSGGRGGRAPFGRGYRRGIGWIGHNQQHQTPRPKRSGWNMSGIGLIFLLLAIVAALCGLYFVAWCMFGVQRNHKEGHYILESEDERHDDDYGKGNLYTGLDMVDEAKESSYVKNSLDLDSINENKPTGSPSDSHDEHVPSAPDDGNSSQEGNKDDLPPV